MFKAISRMYHWNTEPATALVDPQPEDEHEVAPVRVDETHSNNDDVETSFADLGLSPVLLESISQLGFKKPTPIQEAAIPALLNGEDIIGQLRQDRRLRPADYRYDREQRSSLASARAYPNA